MALSIALLVIAGGAALTGLSIIRRRRRRRQEFLRYLQWALRDSENGLLEGPLAET
ncbi:MAG: hypothetical protein K6T61_00160 [Bryobacteraceae bacterium]|nr:hypothetical protein [Bryobacteraceae bacterium]